MAKKNYNDNFALTDRSAVAPTIDSSGISDLAQSKLQLTNYAEGVKDKREKELLQLVDLPFINAIGDHNIENQAKWIEDFNQKWTGVYTSSRGRLSTDQKIELAKDRRDILQKQNRMLSVQGDFNDAVKVMLTPQGQKMYDKTFTYEAFNHYKKTGEPPPEGFLRRLGTTAEAQANRIYKETEGNRSSQTAYGPPDEKGLTTYTKTETGTLTPEQVKSWVDTDFLEFGADVKSTIEDSWSKISDGDRKRYLNAFSGNIGNAMMENHYDQAILSYGLKQDQTSGIRNMPKPSESEKIRTIKAGDDGYAPLGEYSQEVKGQKNWTIIEYNKDDNKVRISKPKIIAPKTEKTFKDEYIKSHSAEFGTYTTFDAFKQAAAEKMPPFNNEEGQNEAVLKLNNLKRSYENYIEEYNKNPETSKTEVEIVEEDASKYSEYLNRFEVEGKKSNVNRADEAAKKYGGEVRN